MSSAAAAGGQFSSFRLILCSHKKQKERNLHSDSPRARGQAKSLKCFRLYCVFFVQSPSQANRASFLKESEDVYLQLP